jgi:hypothetical protein
MQQRDKDPLVLQVKLKIASPVLQVKLKKEFPFFFPLDRVVASCRHHEIRGNKGCLSDPLLPFSNIF